MDITSKSITIRVVGAGVPDAGLAGADVVYASALWFRTHDSGS